MTQSGRRSERQRRRQIKEERMEKAREQLHIIGVEFQSFIPHKKLKVGLEKLEIIREISYPPPPRCHSKCEMWRQSRLETQHNISFKYITRD